MIRVFGFVRKEVLSLLRQPRLVVGLVLGPFLILLLFGLGYRNNPPPFRTLLVLGSQEARLAAEAGDLSEAFGGSIVLEGTSADRAAAEERLRRGEVDLLIIAPDDPLTSLESGERAIFRVVHGEIDPVMRTNIGLIARLSVDEINRRVLADVVSRAQEESETVEDPLADLRQASNRLTSALERGDRSAAQQQLEMVESEVSALEGDRGQEESLYPSVAEALGTDQDGVFSSLRDLVASIENGDEAEALESARGLEASIADLETRLERAQQLEPDVLVSPFAAEVVHATDVPPQPAVFYAPGTLVLLLQHLALTFAALSLVRERQLGLSELFRVSPLSPGQALLGKYLGFGLISFTVALVLTAGILLVGVPVRGDLVAYVAVILLVIFASIGLGLLISSVSKTDSQAVQYSMIVLLVSIFFTGFVLPLDQLIEPVRWVSLLIPATYGIRGLHDVMFRGLSVEPTLLAGLILYTAVLGAVAWWAVRRETVAVVDAEKKGARMKPPSLGVARVKQ